MEINIKFMNSKKREAIIAVLFIIPALIPLVVFWIWPMIYSFFVSFTNWDMMSPQYDMVGFKNYIDLLHNADFYKAIFNTLYFMAGSVIPTIIGGLMLAVLLNKKIKGMGIYRTILFSPWITPTVAVSIVWSWIFEPRAGIANWLLSLIHIAPLQWTQSEKYAMPAILIVTVWKSVGWAMIFYLEALQKVPKELIEAAKIDGANKINAFMKVTLPMISPTTFFLVIMTGINSLQAYDQIQILTQGGPAGSTRTILYMYYQSAFQNFNAGEAAAIATVLILITAILSLIQFIASKYWVHY
jgi:multiple sugar transport system permease protein